MLLIPGIGLIFFPEFLLDIFNIRYSNEFIWMPRMIGLLALVIGVFDYAIGYFKIKKLYPFTIILRYGAAVFMILLWLMQEVEIAILLFAAIDAIAATWTLLVLREPMSS